MWSKGVTRIVGRLFGPTALALAVVLGTASPASSQATGKIIGQVTDAESGQPIAGAVVQVVGTNVGNITNQEGRYFLNEVPAGVHDVRAEIIGYRSVVIEEQRILAGQITTLNFELEQTAVEIEALVVEGERNPLAPRDQTSSKSIITGEKIEELPIDNAQSMVVLQPGVINTNQGRTIRGSRPNEEAVYVDGVLIRSFSSGEAEPVELPTNSLEQLDVTTGGFSARFSDAQSGIVNYVTRSGGQEINGTFRAFTDQLGPEDWRTGFNRAELSVGGPIPLAENLRFFVSGVAEGRKYGALNDGFTDVPMWVASGTDQEFRLPRSSGAPSASDSVNVAFPTFVEWDNGRTFPYNVSDEYTLLAKVSYGFGQGNSLDLSYIRNRDQRMNRAFGELYNPDGWDARLNTNDVLTLGGYFVLSQSADNQLALNLKASYQSDYFQTGEPDPEWRLDHEDPTLGFSFSDVEFLVDADDWPVSETLEKVIRSGAFPAESLQVFPQRNDLNGKQSLSGLDQNLRLNPYGMNRNFPISGFNNGGLEYRDEERWWFSGTLDWQAGRYNRIELGGNLALAEAKRQRVPLFTGTAVPAMHEPVRGGIFIQDKVDIGDVVIEAGLRWDYFDPDGEFPRVPGYVFNVPDSLKADFWRVEQGEGPILDRAARLEDCGGAATAADRTRDDGTVVCKNNFVEAQTRTALAPRLAVSFPVTATSTFRVSYGHNVQFPALIENGVAAGQASLFGDQYSDLQGGLANTNTTFGRDVEPPRTVSFEAGYRQLIGQDLVLDVSAYSKRVRNGITFRKLEFEDPNVEGQPIFINVLTNADFSSTQGFDVKIDKRFGELVDASVNYSFINAEGTGSDPTTFTGLILRRNTNLSIITGQPVQPPEVMLRLDQSRRHNIAGTFSLRTPSDFMSGSGVGNALSDLGVFATMRIASGLPFTRLQNSANGQTGPPTRAGLGGIPAEELNNSTTPWEKRFDLQITKGFQIGNTRVRAFADWRNPLNLTNMTTVFLETGTEFNDAWREKQVQQQMADALLDGDSDVDGFDIAQESPENALNKYSLMQAEARFGNGDGFFAVDEQEAAFGSFYELFWGPQNFRSSNQNLRLGFEVQF